MYIYIYIYVCVYIYTYKYIYTYIRETRDQRLVGKVTIIVISLS